MSKQPPVNKPIYSPLSADIEGFDFLTELALDPRLSWNHAANEVRRKVFHRAKVIVNDQSSTPGVRHAR